MGRKKNGQGKRRAKKKQIAAGEEAEAEAQAQAKPSFPNIPEDIVVEILSRLPRLSLPRFSCVSKQWRSLVSDVVAKITGRKMVLVRYSTYFFWSSCEIAVHSIDEGSRVQQVDIPRNMIVSYNRDPIIFGSCNGLLLISIDDCLFLWNPVTQYFKEFLSHKFLASRRSHLVLGLCYDSSTNDYKAVMGHSFEIYGKCAVDVGSFRNRSWTRVQLPYNLYTVRSGPIVNGHLHWHVSDLEANYHVLWSHRILYFNAQTNQFEKVPMPEAMNGTDGNNVFGFGVLDGCLCMVCGDNSSLSKAKSLEVLAMKEYGIQNSWTKLFSISNLPLMSCCTLEPLCYAKDGEVLVRFVTRSRNLEGVWVYNPINSFFSRFQTEPDCRMDRIMNRMIDVIMYEESLVGPKEELRWTSTYVHYYGYGSPRKWIKLSNGEWRCLEIR